MGKTILPFVNDSVVIWTIIIQKRHSLILLRYRGQNRDRHAGRSRVRSQTWKLEPLNDGFGYSTCTKNAGSIICCILWVVTRSRTASIQKYSVIISLKSSCIHAKCFIKLWETICIRCGVASLDARSNAGRGSLCRQVTLRRREELIMTQQNKIERRAGVKLPTW